MDHYSEENIRYPMGNIFIVGNLFVPKSADQSAAVLVVGPMTSVKEQVTGVYAQALAEQGVVALAIDHRYYGESGGEPRQYEKYPDKIEDIKAAISYLKSRPEVDSERVSLVGVCLGTGYAVAASVEIPDLYRLVGIAGYYRDVAEMKKNMGDFAAKVTEGIQAREHYEKTGEVLTIPAAALDQEAAMQTKDTVDYYTRRAVVSNYVNEFALMSREFFLSFDVQSYANKVQHPFLMIHSENALSPMWAAKFFSRVSGEKKRRFVDSKGQTDFYDDMSIVNECVDGVAEFLR